MWWPFLILFFLIVIIIDFCPFTLTIQMFVSLPIVVQIEEKGNKNIVLSLHIGSAIACLINSKPLNTKCGF